MRHEQALEVDVRGVVQGVGFRPFVHRIALRFGMRGWVRNEAGEVRILIQGARKGVEGFLAALRQEAPPLARIDVLESRAVEPGPWTAFSVIPSELGPPAGLPVSPDVAVCGPCEEELRDPGNRRYRYPFITCTDCGPRFTVIRSMPYDRVRTSMESFPQCPRCQAEYFDPKHRRYHSETNSCPDCGPRIWLERSGVSPPDSVWEPVAESAGSDQVLRAGAEVLKSGGILALRGLGGFHLAVDATNEAAVRRLRERKGREAKPLAVMVEDVGVARSLGRVGPEEERLLRSPERPIVLLAVEPRPEHPRSVALGSDPGKASAPEAQAGPHQAASASPGLAPSVAPGLHTVGIMTPYTPLHHLLLMASGRPLVMTSGNLSEEPIATGNDEARARLAGIADAFLFHDRDIVARYDDSVVQVMEPGPVFLRRARGYAPLPIPLPFATPSPLLAVGPHLKNTFTLAREDAAFVSQHIGDLESLEALEHFRGSLERFQALFGVRPEVVVRDLHPGYLSTRLASELAREWSLEEPLPVQHHHAHIAAVVAEHGYEAPVVGVAYDGSGYGEDGAIWGGEILLVGLGSYRRVGHLRYAPLPGGETAIRQPWRMALGYEAVAGKGAGIAGLALNGIPAEDTEIVRAQARRGINSPMTSSMGRLFDAAAAVLGVRQRVAYEGQAAMEMEALAVAERTEPARIPMSHALDRHGCRVLDPVPLLRALGERARAGEDVRVLAAAFHRSVAEATAGVVAEVCEEHGIGRVALGGGVFQNALLVSLLLPLLRAQHLETLFPRALGPNDGAISYGQAAVAAARLRGGRAIESRPGDGCQSSPAVPSALGGAATPRTPPTFGAVR